MMAAGLSNRIDHRMEPTVHLRMLRASDGGVPP